MEKIATENLFLLEFLVDSVNLDPKCDCAVGEGERCVAFQFLDNAPLDVCEEDFTSSSKQPQNDSIKSGKSCLFSLTPEQATNAIQRFDIYVTIFKRMPAGWLPDKVEIGEALISISNLFSELINSVEASDGSTPTAKTLKDSFVINNSSSEVIGKIGVYIRMSCFGKLIVTQFQMNLEDKSVLFKDKEGKSLYRYKKAGKGRKNGPDTCSPKMPPGENAMQYSGMMRNMNAPPCPTTPCMMMPPPGGNGVPFTPFMPDQAAMGQRSEDPNRRQPPCQECGALPNAPCMQMQGTEFGMNRGMGMGMATPCIECGSVPNAPCLPPQSGYQYRNQNVPNTPCVECAGLENPPCLSSSDPDGNYQEIGASMGGNSLTIRVHKDKNKIEAVDPYTTVISDSNSDVGCSCSPGQVGRKGKKQDNRFDMRPGVQQGNKDLPFSFKMGKSGNTGNNVVVNPPVATAPDGTKFTEFSDPNKELFILRVGKKSEGIDKKQNLELELCTPRGKVM